MKPPDAQGYFARYRVAMMRARTLHHGDGRPGTAARGQSAGGRGRHLYQLRSARAGRLWAIAGGAWSPRRPPAPPSPLVDRQVELAAALELLRQPGTRLLTLDGP